MLKRFAELAWGGQAVDWQERINFSRMRKERLDKTRSQLKKAGIGAALLSGANLRYAAGIRASIHGALGREFAIVSADEKDSLVYMGSGQISHNRVHCSWIRAENFRVCPSFPLSHRGGIAYQAKKLAEMIFQDLKLLGSNKEQIGFDTLRPGVESELRNRGVRLVSVAPLMFECRKIKTADEVDCMKMAAAIGELAWFKVFENLRLGITEHELCALGMEVLARCGAEGPYLVSVRSGPNTAPNYVGALTDRMMRVGDLGFANVWGSMYNGYHASCYRTWKIGTRPTDKENDWYKQAHEWLSKAISAIRHGATTADVVARFPPCKVYGVEQEDEITEHNELEGIGLSLHEPPTGHRQFSLQYPEPIEAGMTLIIATWMGEPFVGGCRIEDTVVVTNTGCEFLYKIPNDQILVNERNLITQ